MLCCSRIALILSDADCEKITAVLLKSRTGEFDLESILFLKLRGLGKVKWIFQYLSLQKCIIISYKSFIVCLLGIHDLGCIGECVNLERLDLSGNNITNLAPLASLRLLSVLNLSANRISNLGKISEAIKSLFPCCIFTYQGRLCREQIF